MSSNAAIAAKGAAAYCQELYSNGGTEETAQAARVSAIAKATAENPYPPPAVPPIVYTECGNEYGLDNHLVCFGYNPCNIQYHHLRLCHGKLELIIYSCMSPILPPFNYDPFGNYIELMKKQTPDATNDFLENIRLMDRPWNDAKEKYGIEPVTMEQINDMKEDGVLKPFRCIME
jgi:hypothetical protein